jgi:outer membrane protein OmpA-like peptidoglycan-associated protein
MKKTALALVLLLFTAGCQILSPPPPPVQAIVAPPPQKSWVEQLQAAAVTLPAALVTTAPGSVTIAYPQERLFARESVLPLPGGAEALDPLATLLKTYPDAIWRGDVRAATENGPDYDLALAQKRSELLQRYLLQAGVAASRVNWQATGSDGIPLELTLQPLQPGPASSSGVKE